MRFVALVLILLATAGLWFWAITTRVEPTPLPERFCGTFQVFRFEPPEGVIMPNPLHADQRQRYEFRPDGTYRLTIRVSGDHEMLRSEGMARLDGHQVLTLRRLSLNRRRLESEPERFGTRWGQDETGPYLLLRHVEQGHSFYLRRVEEKRTEPASSER
jgi:hypothetical protein